MSSFVGLTSLYGCQPDSADCDGATLKTCVDDAFVAFALSAERGNTSKICEDGQKLLDCYDGRCGCTCAELKTEGGEDCVKDEEEVRDLLKPLLKDLDGTCTGDNAVENPCPNA